jgi:RNA polymerase sigma factor (sigma-70 family)
LPYNAAMSGPEADSRFGDAHCQRFATTRWSIVAAAGDPAAPEALATLCEGYWYPLYGYIRRQGYSAHEAQDLTQGFFAGLLERHALAALDPARGKFRSFLLASCKNYLSHERDRARAQKRGGGKTILSLDFTSAEALYQKEPAHSLTPDRLFARRWALTLLDQVLDRLRREFTDKGKELLFDRLRVFLLGERALLPQSRMAEELGMTAGALKVAVHRMRSRFRELVREEIARTVDDPGNVDDEIRELFAALAT